MESKERKNGVAFYEGNSWYHRTKILQDDGTVKYSKKGGFKTEKEAEKSYYKYEDEFKRAYRAFLMKNKAGYEINFSSYLTWWFEEVYSKRVETTTRMVGAYTLYDLIIPNIDQDVKLRYLNSEYLDTLLSKVSGASASAGNKGREFLNIAIKDAVIQGSIKNNPVTNTKPYPRTQPNVIVLSKEKLKVLLAAASDSDWYLEILFGLMVGLRKGEILGLKFSDIDFENESVYIQRQITSNPIIPKGQSKIQDYQIIEKQPKTENSYRILKLPKVILQEVDKRAGMIQKYKDGMGGDFIDNGYISCQKNGLPHSMAAMNNALTKLCKRNGLPHITVHGLRHMYATILLEQGVPIVKISALLGHSSVATTFEYYCSQMDENEHIISFMNNNFLPEGEYA